MATNESSLHKNPFSVLGVTTRDNRHKIMERAEELALHGDQAECQKARSDLTNPRARLSAEVAWLPGVSPRMAEQLVKTISDDPLGTRSQTGLPEIAKANLMAAAIESVNLNAPSPQELADFMEALAHVADSIDASDVMRDINEDRAVAGFPEIRDLAAVEEEIEDRKKTYKNVLKSVLNDMPTSALVDAMTLLVYQSTDSGESPAPSLVDELVDSYEIETQGFLQKEQENITKLAEGALAAAPSGARSVDPLLAKLESVVRNWSRISKPIQISMKARGMDHRHSEEIAYGIRSLGIDLFNKHDLLAQAERTTKLLQEKFGDLPEFAEKVATDAGTIRRLKKEASESAQRSAEWEKEITYRAEIGLVFKDELSISSNGIAWKNVTYSLESINGVRWGAVRKSVNGIPTGTDYTIAFGNSRSSSVVSLNRETVYGKFIECLWRAVCVRLLFEMVKSLKDGNTLSFGTLQVRDGSLQLERHKFLGSNDSLWVPLSEIHVWSADGSFYVGAQNDRKVYGNASYIHHWNTHILEHLIR